ncbi:alpha/beta hydrolase [Streptomyces melanosporofaciens]|uniref:alpha/beta hydrolase n=1 Tax=Streptomyces melanosporofaciens TaxID=67327 RepID=UPI0014321E4F|nr:alpha/beta hydrolase [Streptomyces melanosporofaciens]
MEPRASACSAVTIHDLGDGVADVIDQLGHGPAVILGHAYRNFLARIVATNHPGKVRAVILAAASTRAVRPR